MIIIFIAANYHTNRLICVGAVYILFNERAGIIILGYQVIAIITKQRTAYRGQGIVYLFNSPAGKVISIMSNPAVGNKLPLLNEDLIMDKYLTL